MDREFYVTEEATLDEAAAMDLEFLSIGRIRRLISTGAITLNGKRAAASTVVGPGDIVSISPEAAQLDEIKIVEEPIGVLFEDESVIAVDKPAGVSVVPERGTAEWPFMGMLLYHAQTCDLCRGVRFRIVHRLDRDTSGVVVLAKTLEAGRKLSEAFAMGNVAKRYQAIVRAEPPEESGIIDAPIAPLKRGKALMAVAKDGKPSVTEWCVAERFRGYALLDVFPRTGRTHQIRVHLSYASMPLAVEPMYGGADELFLSAVKEGYKRSGPETPLIERLTLHCAEIGFVHPVTGDNVEVKAPLPDDLQRTLKALRKWAVCRRGK